MRKIAFILTFVFLIISYAFMVNRDLSDNVVRLHVVANSDEKFDQDLKLKVRDAVLIETADLTENTESKADAVDNMIAGFDKIENAAEEVVRQNGYDYDVNIEYGNFYFPEKKYGNIALPSGRYDAIRVNIGKAEGKNWWCVMFPPLCISNDSVGKLDDEALSYLKSVLTDDEYEMITENKDNAVVIRFKLVDTVMKFIEKFR